MAEDSWPLRNDGWAIIPLAFDSVRDGPREDAFAQDPIRECGALAQADAGGAKFGAQRLECCGEINMDGIGFAQTDFAEIGDALPHKVGDQGQTLLDFRGKVNGRGKNTADFPTCVEEGFIRNRGIVFHAAAASGMKGDEYKLEDVMVPLVEGVHYGGCPRPALPGFANAYGEPRDCGDIEFAQFLKHLHARPKGLVGGVHVCNAVLERVVRRMQEKADGGQILAHLLKLDKRKAAHFENGDNGPAIRML